MGYILPEIPTIHVRVFLCHNASTNMTRFKQLVKKYFVYSLTTFPTGTKASYGQRKTHKRDRKRPKTKGR